MMMMAIFYLLKLSISIFLQHNSWSYVFNRPYLFFKVRSKNIHEIVALCLRSKTKRNYGQIVHTQDRLNQDHRLLFSKTLLNLHPASNSK